MAMFSQWKRKRHYPMDAGPSVIPMSSSQPASPVSTLFPRTDTPRSIPPQSFQGRPTGVKTFGKVVIGKGTRRRPATREGSHGTPSPMSFAAGPRNSSRGTNDLEFGGGVVPDDSQSDADLSDSSMSPITPQNIASTIGKQSRHSISSVISSDRATPFSPSKVTHPSSDDLSARVRTNSIDSDSVGSLNDFRTLISFSSPPDLLDRESPALTPSTTLSTPDVTSTVAATINKSARVPIADQPQPLLPASSLAAAEPNLLISSFKISATDSLEAGRKPYKRVPPNVASIGTDESPNNGARRGSTPTSVPESVSQCGSSQLPCEEFQSPGQARFALDTMRGHEESTQRGSQVAVTFGLGISSASEQTQAASSCSSRANHPFPCRSISTHRHTKTTSDLSANSSVDSWGPASFGHDSLRMSLETDRLNEPTKTASSSSIKTHRTYVSDSDHSATTVETSTDVPDIDPLSPIKEHTESPDPTLHQHTSPVIGLSRSPTAAFSEACGFTSSVVSARSDEIRSASHSQQFARSPDHLVGLNEIREGQWDNQQTASNSFLPTSADSMSSPSCDASTKSVSQLSATGGLLPPLELEDSVQRTHARSASNASWTYSRKFSSEQYSTTGPRRGSADTAFQVTNHRLLPETYTAPLPSQPFPLSTSISVPMLPADFARSKPQASEPNTPNLAYEAALAKAVGMQRKHRPAALALNHAALSAFAPSGSIEYSFTLDKNGCSFASPSSFAFKGMVSPGRTRAPPPSAPPAEPLPPIPITPSLTPKSPSVRQRTESCATSVSSTKTFGADAKDPLATPTQVHSSSFSAKEQSQDHSPRLDPASAATLANAISGVQPLTASESANQIRAATQIETEYQGPIQSSSSVLPPAEEGPSRPSTAVSAEESSDSTATLEVAQIVTRTPIRPARLSMSKKGNDLQETSKTAAPAVVAAEHADGQIASPIIKSRLLKGTALVTTANVDAEKSSSTEASSRKVSDNTPQKQTTQFLPSSTQRTSSVDKPSRPPPSAWTRRGVGPIAHTDTSTRNASDAGHGGDEEPRGGASSVASCHSTISNISDRRMEVLQDKEALLSALSESSRKEFMKRAQGRFAGAFSEVSAAFRQLQADKLLLEQIVREKTPLVGVGTNHEMLSSYLSAMNAKVEQSNAEIRKLLDLLEQQREVMDQMMATHQLQRDTYEEDLNHMHTAMQQAQVEAENGRAEVVKLNEELTKAHAQLVQASAEAMRARTTLAEEGRKREKVVVLLRQAKERLREVEAEQQQQQQQQQQCERGLGHDELEHVERLSEDDMRLSRHSACAESEAEQLRRMLAERDAEISALRLSHADSLINSPPLPPASGSTSASAELDACYSGTSPSPSPSSELEQLREQLCSQRERERHIRSAYLYVREELRKVNLERRRSSMHGLVSPASAAAAGAAARVDGSPSPRTRDDTAVKLKRLSLPIVARASAMALASAGYAESAFADQQDARSSKPSSPPSAFRPPSSQWPQA